jgi:hypothetical protein
MPRRILVLLLAVAALLSTACAAIPPPTVLPAGLHSPYTGYQSPTYSAPSMWVCRPDLPSDHCRVDLSATELRADGSRAVAAHVPAAAPAVDCFYVYPTVDLGLLPDNHTDFTDVEPMATATAIQAARLSEVCAVYAPLYRQITIGAYLGSAEAREARLAVAFSDVADAFLHYLGQHNHGRKVALVGHSQGAEMVVRLLQRFVDDDPALRERLLVAMPIGGQVEVPRGRFTGGTFNHLPVCSRPDEPGCVIAYRSHRAGTDVTPGRWAPAPGNVSVCVNPASVDRNERTLLSRAYLPTSARGRAHLDGVEGVTTPFVMLRDYYAAECVEGADGYRFLAISSAPGAGDGRQSPVDLGSFALNTAMGLHVLDLQFPQGDLIAAVARRAAALR